MMFAIIGLGLYSGLNLRQQTTPDFDLNYVSVRVPYLGAAPEEVEEGVVIKIEEAIQDTKGIKKIKSTLTMFLADLLVDRLLPKLITLHHAIMRSRAHLGG